MTAGDVFAPLERVPALTERRSMSDHVAASLRDAIRSGALADGTELNQIVLAAHFGVSRVPVREAMLQLQAEGWITAKRHQRAVVRGISSERIAEILEIRTTLEAFLIEHAVPAMTAATLQRLEAVCDEMAAAPDHRQWLDFNRAFHRILYEPAQKPATMELLDQLTSQVERYVRAHGESIDREREALDEHRSIIAAARAGDVALTQALIRAHIGHTLEHFRNNHPSSSGANTWA